MTSSLVAPACIACPANDFTPSEVPCAASSAIAMRSLTFLDKAPSAKVNSLLLWIDLRSSGSIFSKIFNGCSGMCHLLRFMVLRRGRTKLVLRSSQQSLDIVTMLVIDEKPDDERNSDVLERRTEKDEENGHQRCSGERAQRNIPPLQEHKYKNCKEYRDNCRLECEKETEGSGYSFTTPETEVNRPHVAGKGSKAACCDDTRRLVVVDAEPGG